MEGSTMDAYGCRNDAADICGTFAASPPAGGSADRTEATGEGAAVVTCRAVDQMEFSPTGGHAARFVATRGVNVVAFSDVGGGILGPRGLDWAARVAGRGSRIGGGRSPRSTITNPELLSAEVNMRVPAALESQIAHEVAGQSRAKLVAGEPTGWLSRPACGLGRAGGTRRRAGDAQRLVGGAHGHGGGLRAQWPAPPADAGARGPGRRHRGRRASGSADAMQLRVCRGGAGRPGPAAGGGRSRRDARPPGAGQDRRADPLVRLAVRETFGPPSSRAGGGVHSR